MNLSIIIPLYNEEQSIRALYAAITAAVDPLGLDYEVLFVDDGSQDATFRMASECADSDRRLRVIKFRKNCGQTPAMAAGIDNAKGDVLITMDGDLQNDPADIPIFLEKINSGYDIVVGWRHKRQDKLITRKIPSRIANWLIGKVTGIPIKDNGCSIKAYRSEVIKNVPLYSEMHRFIPAMSSVLGSRIAEIKVRHHARQFGVSKYGLSRIYKVLLDLLVIKTLVSFASRPLLCFTMLAIPAASVSAALLFASIYSFLSTSSPFPVPIAGTGVVFGALAIILVLDGVLGELIYKTGNVDLGELSLVTAQVVSFGTNERAARNLAVEQRWMDRSHG